MDYKKHKKFPRRPIRHPPHQKATQATWESRPTRQNSLGKIRTRRIKNPLSCTTSTRNCTIY